jgi:hypothetical protein
MIEAFIWNLPSTVAVGVAGYLIIRDGFNGSGWAWFLLAGLIMHVKIT